jgi:hypothetical protein
MFLNTYILWPAEYGSLVCTQLAYSLGGITLGSQRVPWRSCQHLGQTECINLVDIYHTCHPSGSASNLALLPTKMPIANTTGIAATAVF